MKTINLLLAHSDRRVSGLIEALVLDVCHEHAAVHCERVSQIHEFLRKGSSAWFQLIIVAPDSLVSPPSRRVNQVSMEEVVGCVRTIKSKVSTPIIAVAVPEEDQLALVEAGADSVRGLPFHCDELKAEVRRALRVEEPVAPEAEVPRWSLGAALLRGLQRLKNA
jgi:hypothetical protein